MKTSTAIILGIAGVGIVYFVTRPKTSYLPGSGISTSSNSLLGQLGQLAGGFIVGSGGTITRPVASGALGGGGGYSGISEAELKNLDAVNIGAYDAQGTAADPVYGIYGLDYT